MAMDFRDSLMDSRSEEWKEIARKSETREAYQLFDGIDIMIGPSPFGPGVMLSRWHAVEWVELSGLFEEDIVIERHVHAAISQSPAVERGWHVLTGPGIVSFSTGNENPYNLDSPMLLPAFLMRLPDRILMTDMDRIFENLYAAGVVLKCGKFFSCLMNEDFSGQADLVSMVRTEF